MEEVLLVIHIVAAGVLLGALVMVLIIGPRMAAAGPEAGLGWARTAEAFGTRVFMPSSILILLTGVGLVLVGDEWDWSDAFISIGFAAIVLGTIIGNAIQGPKGRQMVAALENQEFERVGQLAKSLRVWGLIAILIVLTTIAAMVLRLGV